MKNKYMIVILLLVLMVQSTQATKIDNLIMFVADPSVNTLALVIGSDPWYIMAPYLGAFMSIIAYD